MDKQTPTPTTVDAYIAQFPQDIQQILAQIRAAIKESAPDAEEKISYRMPAYYQNGYLVYFSAHKRHIGLYPAGSGLEPFHEELAAYHRTKGSLHFPLDQPIPYDLIRKIVKFRVSQNLARR
jgi:uncharacterized protein YdhG (YjbR/CyaY superfamily)